MPTLISNEFLKLRTVRGPWSLLAAGPLLVVVGVAGAILGAADVSSADTAIKGVAHGGLMSLLALVFGSLAVAAEYRHKTITDTYLATPRRGRIVVAKLTVYTATGAAFGVVAAATAIATTAVVVAAKGGTADLSNGDLWRTVAGGIAWNAAFAAIGVAVGALIRNLAAAIAVALAWIALVEGLVGQLIGDDLSRWLPFAGGQALGRLPNAPDIPQWAGGLVLLGYVAALAALAVATTVRRDIT
jgi:ABC-2 type transport system permease protein